MVPTPSVFSATYEMHAWLDEDGQFRARIRWCDDVVFSEIQERTSADVAETRHLHDELLMRLITSRRRP